MSMTDYPSRGKDKNYLAYNVQCEPYFFAKVAFFTDLDNKNIIFIHYFIYLTLIYWISPNI